MNKLLLIDGHSILSRAYYGIPLLTASTGIHTNAVYGFLNILFKCIEEEQADNVAVAFDLERHKLKRTQLFPEYKGTRKPMPAELLEQVPLMRRLVKAMNIPVLELEGYEADDLIGTAAARSRDAGCEVTIVSGDRDLLQLCDDNIKVAIPKTSKGRTEVFNYYPENVLEEYRVTPKEFIDLKALMGDTSDNIPGLPGVGEKTATDIIVKYHSIENAKEHAEEIRPPRAMKAMTEHYDMAVLSKQLATIDTSAPVDFDPAELLTGKGSTSGIYTAEALNMIRELELKTIAVKFGKMLEKNNTAASGTGDNKHNTAGEDTAEINTAGQEPNEQNQTGQNQTGQNQAVQDPAGQVQIGQKPAESMLKDCLDRVRVTSDPYLAQVAYIDASEEKTVGLALFTDSFMGVKRAAAGLTLNKKRSFVIMSGEEYTGEQLISDIRGLVNRLVSEGKRIVTLDLKTQLKAVAAAENDRISDLSIALYVTDPGRSSYEYDDLAKSMLGISVESRQELLGKKNPCAALDSEETRENAVRFIAMNAIIPYLADRSVTARLKKDGTERLYNEIEMPLVYTLNDMENAGIRVDRASLAEYAALLKKQIDELTGEIYELAGESFNINSPKQLGVILFEKLGISGGKKTKTGYSTAADVLEKIAGESEIVPKILRYRQLTKLYSTYAAGLDEYIGPDERIHGTFNQTITATGRISSTEPNLQNIPVRTAEGKEIRRVFVPREGFVFVDADYSQVELRILAALSGDKVLIEAYKNAVDIHALTASQVFHVPLAGVTAEMRRNAKAVNFGIVYGISAFGLGEGLSISRKEANEYIEQYFRSYPRVKEYLDACVAEAKEKGFVKTYFGRIRPVPELKSSNFMQRSFGERIAMNSPIQGTAADIMKIAMNSTAAALKGMKSRLVLQVHDELLIETAPDELDRVCEIVKTCMEQAADLPVKLSADIKIGDTWYDCH